MAFLEKDLSDEGILTLTLNSPERLNVLTQDVLKALEETFVAAKDNQKVKALLITGTGRAFCAGADISRLAECNGQTGYQFALEGQRIFGLLESLGKPSLAAVNGYAFGGGCELAIAATLRIASTDAQFGQPEVKLGVIPGYGGTQRLGRLIGKGLAMDLCLTGRFINAATALNWGLVSEVVPQDQLIATGKRILQTILSMAPLAVMSVMEAINRGYNLTSDEALHLEALHFAKVCASEDKKEGVDAFLHKRKPAFQGK